MEDYEDSVKLARAMVEIGRELDKKMEALITNMEQPLGRAVGNAIEMRQHIEILKGNGPKDLRELVARLAGSMLMLDGKEPNREAGYDLAKDRLKSGDAIDKLRQIIEWQNGDPSVIDDSSLFPQASETTVVKAEESGILQSIDAFEVGMAARSLGAGRENLDDDLDYAAGVLVERKVGEPVDEGDALFELKYNDDSELNQAKSRLQSAVAITDRPVEPDPLVQAVIDHEGEKLSREIRFPK
jgi:pyrimidine-nucleoside phosphorylase